MTKLLHAAGLRRRVPVFFYGLFMIPDVLRSHDLAFSGILPAELNGYDIAIDPLSRIYPSEGRKVFGVVVDVSHGELAALYVTTAMEVYFAEPVVVTTSDGRISAALTYRPEGPLTGAERPPGYVDALAAAAREHGFSNSYVRHLLSMA